MSGTVAPSTFEKTMPVNSLMPSVFMHLVGDLLALAGLQPVILDDELERNAAELAALHLDRELKASRMSCADIAAGARQRGDHADLQRLLCCGDGHHERGRRQRQTKLDNSQCNLLLQHMRPAVRTPARTDNRRLPFRSGQRPAAENDTRRQSSHFA